MIEVDYVKISFQKVNAIKSYRPKHPPERYFFWTRYNNIEYYSPCSIMTYIVWLSQHLIYHPLRLLVLPILSLCCSLYTKIVLTMNMVFGITVYLLYIYAQFETLIGKGNMTFPICILMSLIQGRMLLCGNLVFVKRKQVSISCVYINACYAIGRYL